MSPYGSRSGGISIFCCKLENLRIKGATLEWFESLKEGKHHARVNKTISNILEVKTGVPKGSFLGPHLFLTGAYPIDDMRSVFKENELTIYFRR